MKPKVKLRASQERILDYEGGLMGISAVPGSGKTFTLSQLAVKLVLSVDLDLDQEILIVTFSNVAADNFSSRIGKILADRGFMEGYGYKVRTLHGLASDILNERPDLAGLGNDFSIIDAVESNEILNDLVHHQVRQNPEPFYDLVSESYISRNREDKVKKELELQIFGIASTYIKTAKDYLKSVDDLDEIIKNADDPSSLLCACQNIYRGYQSALSYRGAVDFDDLIRLAWQSLNNDPELLKSLQYRWPYILEDEAQDSSLVQEAILSLLSAKNNNWVRVGDPNQAINESFTTADPRLLKSFIKRDDVRSEELPESGRSCLEIINLANMLNEWSQYSHPNVTIRDALSHPFIEPTKPDDPQQNPNCIPPGIDLHNKRFSTEQEKEFLVKDIQYWLENHPEDTIAVLALTNDRVGHLAEAFKKAKIPLVLALMRNPKNTRDSAGSMYLILRSLQDPTDPKLLAYAFKVLYRHYQDDEENWLVVEKCWHYIRNLDQLENLIYDDNNANTLQFEDMLEEEIARDFLQRFILVVRKWHKASILPLDQAIITIAQDLVLDPIELATIHKLAQLVRQILRDQPDWSISDIYLELRKIAQNKRAFFSFNDADDGFNPDLHKGEVVVATYHKAKGLEWDKVYLSSLNTFDFPSGAPDDYFLSERDLFVEPKNRQAEIKMELKCLVEKDKAYVPGVATLIDRNDVSRERIRLLYVGITRAKKSLTATFNTGRFGSQNEALTLKALRSRWQNDF